MAAGDNYISKAGKLIAQLEICFTVFLLIKREAVSECESMISLNNEV